MSQPFTFNIKVEGPVEDRLARHFADLCRTVQGRLGAIAGEHQELLDRVAQLEAENRALRSAGSAAALRQPPPAPKAPPVQRGPPPEPEETGNMARNNWGGAEETQTFTLERSFKIHEAPVHSLKMSPSGDTVATASWDTTVKLYSLGSEEVVRTLGRMPGEEMGGLYSVAFAKTSPNILGCTSNDRSVYLWDHHTGTLSAKLTGHADEVNGIDFHSSQHVICTASDDCKALIWDIHEGIILRTLDQHTKAVYGTAFLGQENQYLVGTCCFDQKTRIFDMRDKKVVATLGMHTDDVVGIDYNSPKQLLATGSDDGVICIWDVRSFTLQQKINTREQAGISDNEVKRVSFSPNGNLIAAACSTGRVLVYDIHSHLATAGSTQRPHASLCGHGDCVFDIAWGVCPQTSAKLLVSASHDHTCRYWREVLQ